MVKKLGSSTVFLLQAWSRSLVLNLEKDLDQPGVWWVGHFCTSQTTCRSTGLFGLQQATLLCWTFSCHCCLAESHLTALIHYIFVLSPHLPGMLFSLSQKSGFLRPIPLRFLMWIMITKGRLGFQPILFWRCLCMPFVSLTSIGVYPLIHVFLQTAKYWYVFVNPSSG